MNTTFRLVVACPKEHFRRVKQILQEAHTLISQLEQEISEFDEQSPVFLLNEAEVGKWIPFSKPGTELLKIALFLQEISGDAFSPLAKSSAADATLKTQELQESFLVCKTSKETHLSFGAIGKGFALDQVREKLEAEGLQNYLLEAGGSSTVFSGFASHGKPWTWSWAGFPFSHFTGKSMALGVSGTEEKGAHILDPRNPPSMLNASSSLVGHASATYADALSTALFVSGWEEALQNFERLIEKPALGYIDSNQVPRWNGTFQNYWGQIEC